MFAELPPLPPEITAQQAADLRCVQAGRLLERHPEARGEGLKLVGIFLPRLQASDPNRDWQAAAHPLPDDILYGDFMGIMNICADAVQRRRRPPKPAAR